MPFLSDTQLVILQQNGSEANRGKDHYPVVKLFSPDATAIWLITELAADKDTAFGLCDLGHDHPELGYIRLSALDSLRGEVGFRGGLGVESDEAFDGNYPLSVYAQAASIRRRIVTKDEEVRLALKKRPLPGITLPEGGVYFSV